MPGSVRKRISEELPSVRECPGRFEGQSCKMECPERMGTSENLGACLRGQKRLEIRGVAPLSSVSRLSLARSRYARPVAVPGCVKIGDLRVSEDEIRILSFHVQLQRAFARWRIMEPFANSHAREITAGHVDRAAAMCQSGERRSLNSLRRPGEIDSPCFGSRWLCPGGRGPGKYSASKSRIAEKLSGGPLQIGRKGLLGWRCIVDMNAPPSVCHKPPILARGREIRRTRVGYSLSSRAAPAFAERRVHEHAEDSAEIRS